MSGSGDADTPAAVALDEQEEAPALTPDQRAALLPIMELVS